MTKTAAISSGRPWEPERTETFLKQYTTSMAMEALGRTAPRYCTARGVFFRQGRAGTAARGSEM
ncbi:MAG: hypothetical protein ACLR9I_11140 [Eisenbergiella sp.]